MYFQLRYITTDFDFEGQEISTSDSIQKMIFVLRKRVPQDAERPPMEPMDGFATVTCERDLAARLHEEAISSGMLSIKKGAVRQMHRDMYSFMLHAIRLIRWRANSQGRPHPIRSGVHGGFRWSSNGKDWTPVADFISMTLQFHVNSSWNEQAEQFVGKEVTGSVDEPIGHVLLREAWANQTENLRSSIVLAVAAAEVGFKQFASIVLPDSDWLLESIQSPPLIKMLTELFPWTRLNVQIGGQTLKPPASAIEILKKAVLLRNDIVHGRANTLTRETAASIVIAVRDLLYFLDVAQGREWALSHLSAEARNDFPQITSWPLLLTPPLPR